MPRTPAATESDKGAAPPTEMQRKTVIGKGFPKLDAPEKATGRAIYIHDIVRPRMLHGAILRSDRVHARIVRIDTVEDLMRQTEGRHIVRFAVSNSASELCDRIVAEFPNLQCQVVAGGSICVESSEPVRVGQLVRLLEDRGAEVSEARKVQPSLEDVFVRVTGIEAGAMKQEKAKMGGVR